MNIESLNRARNVALAAMLAMGLTIPTAGLAYAADDDGDDTTTKVKDKLNNLFKDEAQDEKAPKKTESVYIFANADGSVKNTVVTNWLKNPTDAAKIHDISSLTDIQNTEGKETFEAKGQSLVWDAQGSDIYYQGNTDKKAPVELKITYWLDGKETPADQMAGKSGHVKIRFDYTNNSSSTEYVAGAARTVYTPFVCVTGMMLDNSVFKNVSTKNARVLNDGDRTMVGGYALPGLQEDLDIDKDTVDLPTYFEIEADVQNFEMGTTATIVSSNLLNNLNTDELDTSELGDALNELSDAMGQLIDGTSELYKGMDKLDEGGKKLADGTGELQDKTPTLKTGVTTLAKGITTLAGGAAELAAGTGALKEGTETLAKGTSDLADGAAILAASTPGLAQGASDLADGAAATADGASKLPDALKQLEAELSAIPQGIGEETDTENTTLLGGVNQIKGSLSALKGDGSDENPGISGAQVAAQQISQGVDGAVDGVDSITSNMETQSGYLEGAASNISSVSDALTALQNDPAYESLSDETRGAIDAAVSKSATTAQQIDGAQQVNAGIQGELPNMKTGLQQAQGAANAIDGGLGDALKGIDALSSGTDGLKDGLKTIKAGVQQATGAIGNDESEDTILAGANSLKKGAAAVSAGAKGVSDGAAQVNTGANQLNDGASQVNTGAQALDAGAGEVDEGASALSEGANKLDDGASKLKDAIPALMSGIKALAEGADQLSDGIGAAKEGTGKLKDGIQQLNDEGIQKIVDAYHDNLDGLSDRLKATVDAGKAYNTFTGKSDDMQGNVKFIFETDAIEINDGEE